MSLCRVAAVTVLGLSLLAAEPVGTPKAVEPGPAAAAAVDPTALVNDLKMTAQLDLLDPGAEPRAPIRFVPKPRKVVTVEQVQDTSVSIATNGQARPIQTRKTITTSRNSVGQPDSDGRVPVTVELLDIRVVPATGSTPAAAHGGGQGTTIDTFAGAGGGRSRLYIDSLASEMTLDASLEVGASLEVQGRLMRLQMSIESRTSSTLVK